MIGQLICQSLRLRMDLILNEVRKTVSDKDFEHLSQTIDKHLEERRKVLCDPNDPINSNYEIGDSIFDYFDDIYQN